MKKMFLIAGIVLLSMISELSAQKYAVHFTDKSNSPYSIDEPLEFLSQRALDRRAKFNIAVTEEDFPVNPEYLNEIQGLGAQLLFSSRWLNCALVIANDNVINAIEQLPFVEKTVYVAPETVVAKATENSSVSLNKPHEPQLETARSIVAAESTDYGYATTQIQQLNGIALHDLGFKGEGILIAILDAGFEGVDEMDVFEPLFSSNRVLMAKDFVVPNGDVYAERTSTHGTAVLSCIGSYIPGLMVGTAPEASFCLFRTEQDPGENLIECYNWVIGAEAADSIGADIINSSLGYNTFDDPSMDYTYDQMDGMTAISSIGATKLIQRGVPCVISAGNSNGSSWPWVGTPSDVPEALTIGAVDEDGNIASFSSIGPNGAGFQKPDVVAMGVSAAIAFPDNNIYAGSGTSFSSPILCGMTACLMQAFPEKTSAEIKEKINSSATQWNQPDIYYGYGIPDFLAAYQSLVCIEECKVIASCNVFPNPTTEECRITASEKIASITVFDMLGKQILTQNVDNTETALYCKHFSDGIYLLKITLNNGKTEFAKIVKQ
ncbi:MAG: S8 family peptidase [Bacteroidales bacterium]|nr:S8 family peptidase [Bacteroidales bacterium]